MNCSHLIFANEGKYVDPIYPFISFYKGIVGIHIHAWSHRIGLSLAISVEVTVAICDSELVTFINLFVSFLPV